MHKGMIFYSIIVQSQCTFLPMQFEHWLIYSIYQHFLDLLRKVFVNRFMFYFEVNVISQF